MQKFEPGQHYTKRTILEKGERRQTELEITHWQKENEVVSVITLDTGSCHLHINITPAEARKLAEDLLLHADEAEAQELQLTTKLKLAA